MTTPTQAVILAGGKGTRLAAVSGGLPKPLVLVEGESVLARQLDLCARHGVTEAVLLVGFGGDAVRTQLGPVHKGVTLRYVQETEPLGTAGSLLAAYAHLAESFFVLYADTVLNVDLRRFAAFHQEQRADITLLVHPNSHPLDSDIIEYGDDHRVQAFHSYPHPSDAVFPNSVNAALYVIQKQTLAQDAGLPRPEDLCKHLFPRLHRAGCRLFAYPSREYIKDMGTPERLEQVSRDVRTGWVAAGSFATPQRAIVFDRDGTLTASLDYVREPKDLVLYDDAAPALTAAHAAGFLTVLATNQPVLARGEATPEVFATIHNKLAWELGRHGAYLDGVYFCPHHPDGGFPGEVPALKHPCDCRKPEIGMITKAQADMVLDLAASWMVGDTTTDMMLARRAGLRSVLVRTGVGGTDRRYDAAGDFEAFDVLDAVTFITRGFAPLMARAHTLLGQLGQADTVLIGGLARSGKTSLASALRLAIQESGRSATVLELDSWVRPLEARGPSILEGYDVAAFLQFLAEFRRHPVGTAVRIPVYDRQHRRPIPDARTVARAEVLIIEGVPALLHPELCQLTPARVYAQTSEATRRARFRREYRLRGFTDRDADELFNGREVSEHPHVRTSREHATYVVELDA